MRFVLHNDKLYLGAKALAVAVLLQVCLVGSISIESAGPAILEKDSPVEESSHSGKATAEEAVLGRLYLRNISKFKPLFRLPNLKIVEAKSEVQVTCRQVRPLFKNGFHFAAPDNFRQLPIIV